SANERPANQLLPVNRLERPLGRRNHAAAALVAADRHAQRAGKRLEYRLRLVVSVVAAQVVDVQADQRVIDEALKELMGQIDVESADHRPGELDVVFESGPPGEVDDDPRQGLVERHIRVAVAHQPGFVAQRLLDRLAEGDADVLDGVMTVDVQIALGIDRQVDHAVARDLIEHVVEERYAGRKLGAAAAVEIDAYDDPRLASRPFDSRLTRR